jgi:hypothetical protein
MENPLPLHRGSPTVANGFQAGPYAGWRISMNLPEAETEYAGILVLSTCKHPFRWQVGRLDIGARQFPINMNLIALGLPTEIGKSDRRG